MTKKVLTTEWFQAAGIRAIKTAAQTALSMFVVGMTVTEVDWRNVVGVAIVAAVFSMLTSLAGLPEVGTDGTLKLDTSEDQDGVYKFAVDVNLDEIKDKNKVRLDVDSSAKLD